MLKKIENNKILARLEITNCDLQSLNAMAKNSNMIFSGN
jgi:hypothetical protein